MFCTMTEDTGCRNVLFDIEDGAEGEEVNIEADVDTEVEPVKKAVGPTVGSKSILWPTFPTGHGVDGVCWAVGVVYSIVHAPVR